MDFAGFFKGVCPGVGPISQMAGTLKFDGNLLEHLAGIGDCRGGENLIF